MSKKMGHQSATFRFKMGIFDEPNCHFYTNRYKTTGNLYVAIMDAEGSPYITVSVNPPNDFKLTDDFICVKDYSENEGMVDWLKEQGLIEGEPKLKIASGFVLLPVYKLSAKGKEAFGV